MDSPLLLSAYREHLRKSITNDYVSDFETLRQNDGVIPIPLACHFNVMSSLAMGCHL